MKALIDKRNFVLGMLHDGYITRLCLVYVINTLGSLNFSHVYVLTPPLERILNGIVTKAKVNISVKLCAK